MIPVDILGRLQQFLRAASPPLIEGADAAQELPSWTPGQRLAATVVSTLASGRFQVLVANQLLDLNLPSAAKPGDKLDLTFVSGTPRPTFALTQDLAPRAPGNTAPVTLSEAAKYLGALLDAARSSKEAASPLTAARPLSPQGVPDPKALAPALHQAISESGLFYESHQVQWLAGDKTVGDLLREPQGQLSPRLQNGGGTEGVKDPLLLQGARGAEAAANAARPAMTAGDGVNPHTAPVVQQQLNTLNTGHVFWQGPVWPGQQMEWQIREDREGAGDEPEAFAWQTRLSLSLPRLGEVTALMRVNQQGMSIALQAVEEGTRNLARDAHPRLLSSLEAAGIRMLGFTVTTADEKV